MKNTLIIISTIIVLIGCNNTSSDYSNKKVANEDTLKYMFDTIYYVLPDASTEKIYNEINTPDYLNLNFCLALFTDTTVIFGISYQDKNNNILLAKQNLSNRVLKVKNKLYPVYFESDYYFSKKNTTPLVIKKEIHPKEICFVLDFQGNLISIRKSSDITK
jgi:hypothetical protein